MISCNMIRLRLGEEPRAGQGGEVEVLAAPCLIVSSVAIVTIIITTISITIIIIINIIINNHIIIIIIKVLSCYGCFHYQYRY